MKICQSENIQFDIIEEMETEKTENYFKNMILDLYEKCDEKDFKNIINIMIGKFESYSNLKKSKFVSCILNDDELKTIDDNFFIKLGENLNAILEERTTFNIFNKKPISVQIKDNSRVILYKMMKNLKLNTKDIIQIKTDSITFINKKNNKEYLKYVDKSLDGWKIEKYSKINNPEMCNTQLSFIYKKKDNINENILGDCYAGSGKTYKIINEYLKPIINEYTNERLDISNYIILTPSHATLKFYRQNNFKCNVIQKYTLNNKIPDERFIIIDEVGMISAQAWNMLFKCKLMDKKIYCYGDQNQLLPVGCDQNLFSQNFMNYMFYKTDKMTTNYRNNFTKEYYDSLINSNNHKYLVDECFKYSTDDYTKAEVIIAYKNETRQKYNRLMCEYHKINNKTDINTNLICITNDLRKYEIYNKFSVTVINKTESNLILTDGQREFSIPIELIEKNFDYGYCRTLYSVQGETLESYHYCKEDKSFLNNQSAYTLISRLKQ